MDIGEHLTWLLPQVQLSFDNLRGRIASATQRGGQKDRFLLAEVPGRPTRQMAAKERPGLRPAKLQGQLGDHRQIGLFKRASISELGHKAILDRDDVFWSPVEFAILTALVDSKALLASVDGQRQHLAQGSQDAGVAHLTGARILDREERAVVEMDPGLKRGEIDGRRIESLPNIQGNVGGLHKDGVKAAGASCSREAR